MLVILVIIIILIIFVGISFAKYRVNIDGNVLAKIAKPIVELRGEQSISITAINPKSSYIFEVRNYNDKKQINEVDMEYYIEIISKVNSSIEFSLYKEENKINLKDNKTDKILLTKENKEEHKYRLDITYTKDNKLTDKDINENIEIKIHSIQKM